MKGMSMECRGNVNWGDANGMLMEYKDYADGPQKNMLMDYQYYKISAIVGMLALKGIIASILPYKQ